MTSTSIDGADEIREPIRLRNQANSLAAEPGILNILSYAEGVQDESKSAAQESLFVELTLANSLIASSAWFAMALHSNLADQRFFPPEWLAPAGQVNPDFIVSCVLCQLANYGHAVVTLVSKGVDTPARALVRATAELSYLLAVIASDQEIFQKYALDQSCTPKEQWYRLFSNRKIAARMARIDTALSLPKEWTASMREFRESNGEFFSQAVHHSYNAVVIGALPTQPGTDRVELAVLGGAPTASRATLGYLISTLNYGLSMFLASARLRAGWTPSFVLNDFWESGKDLLERTQPNFTSWLKLTESDPSAPQSETK